jgi:hypothetical protein
MGGAWTGFLWLRIGTQNLQVPSHAGNILNGSVAAGISRMINLVGVTNIWNSFIGVGCKEESRGSRKLTPSNECVVQPLTKSLYWELC